MIVVDASAQVEALVGRSPEEALFDALAGDVCAPHLLDAEVLSALRGLVLGGRLAAPRAERAWADHSQLAIQRYETLPLAQRVWQLRNQFTVYDAHYLALAEVLDVPLFTCDAKLAGSGHRADVRVMARSQ